MESEDLYPQQNIGKLITGKIRSIKVTYPDKNFEFTVGQTVMAGNDEIKVSQIVRDENNFYFFGTIRYVVFAKKGDSEFAWRYYEGLPVSVTCFVE